MPLRELHGIYQEEYTHEDQDSAAMQAHKEEWANLEDPAERRRVQNKLSQRRFRR
jgi:hypothetical protein